MRVHYVNRPYFNVNCPYRRSDTGTGATLERGRRPCIGELGGPPRRRHMHDLIFVLTACSSTHSCGQSAREFDRSTVRRYCRTGQDPRQSMDV